MWAPMNYALFKALNSIAVHGGPAVDAVVRFLAADGVLLFPIVIVLLWIFPGSNPHRTRSAAVLAAVAVLLALVFNQILGHLFTEARPFVTHRGHVDQLMAHTADNSFPSDHTAVGFGAAAGLWWARRRLSIVLGILALIVGLSRVVAGLHYPVDILGGAVDGIVAALVLWAVARRPIDWITGLGERVYGRVVPVAQQAGRHRATD